ncbi:LLM class flavin-dependent oxidoreductase [Nocardia sp. NPDC004278]
MSDNFLRFGTFTPPYHPLGINPTLALKNDIRTVQLLEDCGTARRGSVNTTPVAGKLSRLQS